MGCVRQALLYSLFLFIGSSSASFSATATTITSSNLSTFSGFTGEAAAGYNWGEFLAQGQPTDARSGLGLHVFGGYRFAFGLELGPTASFGFPQITTANTQSDAAFSYRAFGAQLGFLWLGRLEIFGQIFPFAQLSQNSSSRLGTSFVQTELSYRGQAYGGGAKLYFTERDNNAAQIGLRFVYLRERYTRSTFSSKLENPNNKPSPDFMPTTFSQTGNPLLIGNTYEMGLFIGI